MLNQIKDKILASSDHGYIRNTLILFLGSSSAHLIAIISLPIITRLYSPDQFGKFGIFLSLVGVIAVFASGKFELAIINERIKRRQVALAYNAILSTFFVVFLLTIIRVSFEYYLPLLVIQLFKFVIVAIIFTVLHDCLVNLHIAANNVKPISIAKVVRITILNSVQIALPFLGFPNAGLFMGEISGRFSGAFFLLNFKAQAYRKLRIGRRIRYQILLMHKYRDFPLKTAPGWTINNAAVLLLPIFLGWHYGLAIAGGFFLIYKIFSLPEIAIVQSINQAFMVEFSASKDSPEHQLYIFDKTVRFLFGLSLLVFPLLGVTFYYGVEFIFGSNWGEHAIFAIIMIPYFIAQFTMSALYVSLNIIGKQTLQLSWDIFRSGAVGLLCYLAIVFNVDVTNFVAILSCVTLVSYYILLLIIRKNLIKNIANDE